MPYVGGKLQSLFVDWLPTREAAIEIAEAGGDALRRRAAELTPKGTTGEAARSWKRGTVKRRIVGGGTVEVSTEAYSGNRVVHWLNDGTKPHEVKPDKAEALQLPAGERASAHVSGIRPHKMIERAAAEVETQVGELAQPALERWKQKTEDAAKTHKGVQ